MAEGQARAGWDIDFRDGLLREDAFARVARLGTVEHKRDHGYINTGNLYVEYKQRTSRGWEPSGIAVSTADHWAFEFLPDTWLVIPTDKLRAVVRKYGLENPGRSVFGGDNNNTRGILIPLAALVRGRTCLS